ncbi:TIGR03086 family protein [Streptomyces antimycoticus]|uniref:TIGR03086 family protein n=1 Tax=Streptomyces antimycoticus TaxID=68175 RepID=A0A499UZA7_9ACTN|nr:TIGR03086 family metal-binding protein [Streptomyces antimycoticus]BBJ42611.1 TIGR03086 family protein [Streptomyces antimycoticus]
MEKQTDEFLFHGSSAYVTASRNRGEEPVIDLKPACRQMIDVLTGVSNEQLTSPTRCTEYTVHDLILHVDGASQGFTGIARKDADTAAAEPTAANLGDDWRGSIAENVRALGDAWDDPAAWQGRTDAAGVDLPNDTWGKIALTEIVVHGWDIARATNQPFDLPDDTLQACYAHVAAFVPNAPIEGLWGPAVEIPTDASLLDRIVAITGRRP